MKKNLYIGFFIFTLLACTSEKSVDELLVNAEHFISEGQQGNASIELKNALQLEPENARVRYLLGSLYLEQGNAAGAQKELERAYDAGYREGVIVELLAQSYYLNNDARGFDDLLVDSDIYTKSTLITVYVYKGLLALQYSDRQQAQTDISTAISINEKHPYARLGKAWLLASDKNSESLAIVERLLKENSLFSDAVLLKGHLLSAQGNFSEAGKQYITFIKKHPNMYPIYFFAVNSLISANDIFQAEEINKQLLELFPNQPLVNQQQAQIEFIKKDYVSAERYANKSLLGNNKNVVSGIISGVSAFKQNKYEQAYKALAAVKGELTEVHPINKLYMMVQLQLGYVDDASKSFEQLGELSEEDINLLELASARFASVGYSKTATQALGKAVEIAPEDKRLLTKMGSVKVFQGDKSGIEYLENAVKLDTNLVETNYLLAMSYLEQGEYDKAEALVKNWQAKSNDDKAYLLEGLILEKQNKNTAAKVAYQKAIEIEPSNNAALFYLGRYAEREAKVAEARDIYKNVLKVAPYHEGALAGIFRTGENPDNFKFLRSIDEFEASDLRITLLVVGDIHATHGADEAINYLLLKNALYGEEIKYLIALGDLYISDGQLDNAFEAYNKIVSTNKYDLIGWLRLLTYYEKNKQPEKALDTIEQALLIFESNEQLKMLKVHFLLMSKNTEQAQRELLTLSTVKHPFILKLKAGVDMLTHKFDAAAQIYGQIYNQHPIGSNVVNYAQALFNSGQKNKTFLTLENHVSTSPNDSAVRALLADFYMKEKRLEEANQHYEKLLKLNPDNPVVLNNLAWVYLELKQYPKALDVAYKAYYINKNDIQIIDTLGYTLFKNGQTQKAVDTFRANIQKIDNDIAIKLHYAEVLVANNQKLDAQDVLHSIQTDDKLLRQKINSILMMN
ncbi:XrtA/PEP-CTERM system TPR-repeat protein PrsT [Colwelliaceae bacterium 6471]